MKKSFWILGLILLFFIGDRVGGHLLKRIADQSQFRYSWLYSKNAKSDILFVGNSRGLMFYQPYIEEKTNFSTLNLSYNGMPMNLANLLWSIPGSGTCTCIHSHAHADGSSAWKWIGVQIGRAHV